MDKEYVMTALTRIAMLFSRLAGVFAFRSLSTAYHLFKNVVFLP